MNKFILGSILAAISLMAIYGTSASNQVTSWVDGSQRTSAQSNSGSGADGANAPGTDGQFVALNETDGDSFTQVGNRTPLEKAGEIPQRQTVGVQSAPAFGTSTPSANTGDDTDGAPVTANPPAQNPPAQTAPGANQTPNQTPNQNQQPPIRALW